MYKMKSSVYCLVIVAATVLSVNGIRWKDCGSVGSTVNSVSVTGCSTTDVCQLTKGKNSTIEVDFTTKTAFQKATAVVHGIVAHIPVPFKIPQSDGCQQCGLTCPVSAGATEKYSTNIFIKPDYPSIKVVVEWELKDEKKNDIFCIEVAAEVTG